MAQQLGIPFLGKVPVDVKFGELVEGKIEESDDEDEDKDEQPEAPVEPDLRPLVEKYKEGWSYARFEGFAKTLLGGAESTAGAS